MLDPFMGNPSKLYDGVEARTSASCLRTTQAFAMDGNSNLNILVLPTPGVAYLIHNSASWPTRENIDEYIATNHSRNSQAIANQYQDLRITGFGFQVFNTSPAVNRGGFFETSLFSPNGVHEISTYGTPAANHKVINMGMGDPTDNSWAGSSRTKLFGSANEIRMISLPQSSGNPMRPVEKALSTLAWDVSSGGVPTLVSTGVGLQVSCIDQSWQGLCIHIRSPVNGQSFVIRSYMNIEGIPRSNTVLDLTATIATGDDRTVKHVRVAARNVPTATDEPTTYQRAAAHAQAGAAHVVQTGFNAAVNAGGSFLANTIHNRMQTRTNHAFRMLRQGL